MHSQQRLEYFLKSMELNFKEVAMNGIIYSNRNTMRISKDTGYSKDNSKSLYAGEYAKRGDEISEEIKLKKKPLTILNQGLYVNK